MDKDEIKRAIDAFENDDFVTSKEILKTQIAKARNEYIRDKTGVQDIDDE